MSTGGDGRPRKADDEKRSTSPVLRFLGSVIVIIAGLIVEVIAEDQTLGLLILAFAFALAAYIIGTLLDRHIEAVKRALGRILAAIPGPLGRFRDRVLSALHSTGEWLRRQPPRLADPLRRLGRLLSLATAAALGAAVMIVVLELLPGPSVPEAAAGRPCQPVELRVLTSPENRDAVQEAADDFAVDLAGTRSCPPVHITVFSEASFAGIREAFAHGWQDLSRQATSIVPALGPQPDVWIPSSEAELDVINGQDHPDVELESRGSVATSPLVLAVPENYRRRMEGNLAATPNPNWRDLIAAAKASGLGSVVRPDPDLSETGLLATADLYDATHGETAAPAAGDRDRRAIEQSLASVGGQGSDAHDLLCSIRSDPDPNPTVAVIVPEKARFDYNRGHPLGSGCPLQITRPPRLYHAFRIDSAGSLDYPVVRVTWQHRADPGRDALIDRFKTWLEDGRLQASGYRDTAGRTRNAEASDGESAVRVHHFATEAVARTPGEYQRARSAVTAAFVVDVSSSMNGPAPLGQASRIDRARELALLSLGLLGPADSVGLTTFPRGTAGDDVTSTAVRPVLPAVEPHPESVRSELSALTRASGGHTPLFNAIDDAVTQLGGRGANPAVVVFTDGDDSVRGGISAAELKGHLAAAATRIVFLAVGPQQCDQPDVLALTADPAIDADCFAETTGETDQLLSRVSAALRKGAP